jgi:hypothetical protein
MLIEIEVEIYLVELHHHRTVPQPTPGFYGAQVRYISIYKLSICKANTHMLLKVFMPVAILIPPLSSLTISTPKLYFGFQLPLGGVVTSPNLFFHLRLVLNRYFPRDFILLTFVQLIISRSLLQPDYSLLSFLVHFSMQLSLPHSCFIS